MFGTWHVGHFRYLPKKEVDRPPRYTSVAAIFDRRVEIFVDHSTVIPSLKKKFDFFFQL
jgi:hypothetical protein